jgi:Polymer-forming cytoskeletal
MTPQDTLTIDPVAMNVVSRIAAGCRLTGEHRFEGGVLVQGTLGGRTVVEGKLIVWQGALVHGHIKVIGDLYLFGQLGQPGAAPDATVLQCTGTAYVASTGVSTGTLTARRLQLYEGADLQGPFRTLAKGDKTDAALPGPPVLAPARPGGTASGGQPVERLRVAAARSGKAP